MGKPNRLLYIDICSGTIFAKPHWPLRTSTWPSASSWFPQCVKVSKMKLDIGCYVRIFCMVSPTEVYKVLRLCFGDTPFQAIGQMRANVFPPLSFVSFFFSSPFPSFPSILAQRCGQQSEKQYQTVMHLPYIGFTPSLSTETNFMSLSISGWGPACKKRSQQDMNVKGSHSPTSCPHLSPPLIRKALSTVI